VTDEALDLFHEIVGGNCYLILATADADGVPWSSPVWFASADPWHFVWGSKPGAQHSRNIAVRREVAISIFDSTQRPGTGRGAYLRALAEEVAEPDVERWLAVYNGGDDSLPPWAPEDVLPGGRHRLYVATAVEHFVLSAKDERIPVTPRA
jgi:hypothetical protein